MNSNNSNNDKNREINDKITRFGAVLIALSVISFCFAYTRIESFALRISLYVLSALIAALGVFIITVIAVGAKMEKNHHNFFLYDKKKKKDILPSELTVRTVRERINLYMGMFKRFGLLYIGELFDDRNIPEHYKTLFCYELLCQVAEDGTRKAEIFLLYGAECGEIFSKYLSQSEDYELAKKIKSFIFDYADKKDVLDEFIRYLLSQKEHIESKMLSYTVNNIDKF